MADTQEMACRALLILALLGATRLDACAHDNQRARDNQERIRLAGGEARVRAAMAAPNATEITREGGQILLDLLASRLQLMSVTAARERAAATRESPTALSATEPAPPSTLDNAVVAAEFRPGVPS